MFFTSNVKILRKRLDRTQDEVATAVNMKRSTLSGYENGVCQPNIEALTTFSNYYKVSIDTLLRIDLSQLSENQLVELERGTDMFVRGTNLRVIATTVDTKNNENIELVPEKAKAGYTTGYADPEYIRELPVFQLPFLSKQKKYRTFQLKGDSMLPIPDKSWVTCEYLQNWNDIINGHGYIVFTMDEGIVFKIAENRINDEGKITLYSLNPIYEPYDVQTSEIKEVWKFANYISSELPDPIIPHNSLLKTIVGMKRDMTWMKQKMGDVRSSKSNKS